ncbi:MAG: hypothetical protein AUK28_09460 [Desulfobacterales bacterium CG2_30_60_27]|nr:MAG: hypothetical protein AUK28_09460 [Desulfobacterales bacterium CG2_30_60_27]
MNNHYTGEACRRQAVRVEDRILLSWSPVSMEKFAVLKEYFNRGIPPYLQEGLTEIQMYVGTQSALARIQQRDEDLGRFLQHLDTKVNMLLQKVTGGASPLDRLALQEVILSSVGLSFPAAQALEPGAMLEFNLVLLPDYVYVYCLGEVVGCRPHEVTGGDPAQFVSCRFALIMEEDRERLVQHSFKKQSLALRNRRLTEDS